MFDSHFSIPHQVALAVGVLVLSTALVLRWKGRNDRALIMLTAGALVMRLFAATLDPFLNQWDECYHALVAKRMLDDPFTPMLFAKGVLPTTAYWTHADIWLHKPPFFLWQISASLAFFGVEPWAVRLPSALWLTALVPITYRMGRLLADERSGWVAALFTSCPFYLLELTAGAVNTDHNDAIFIGTLACSWWALLEHWKDGRKRWAVAAGAFAACAILTKLFIGLSVFLPWGVAVLWNGRDRRARRGLVLGVITCLTLILPWFGSTAMRFPEAFDYQWTFKIDHLVRPMETHSGSWMYHFEVIDRLIPPFTWWVVIPALGYLVWSMPRREHAVLVVSLVVAIHALFAVASTKMVSYTLVLFPLYMIAAGHGMVRLTDTIIEERFRQGVLALSSVVLAFTMLDLYPLQERHTLASPPRPHQNWRQQQIGAMKVMEDLGSLITDPARSVVFHVPAVHHIQFMFATGMEATDHMPGTSDLVRLRELGYTVYAVQDGEPLERFPPGTKVISDGELRFPDVGRPGP